MLDVLRDANEDPGVCFLVHSPDVGHELRA